MIVDLILIAVIILFTFLGYYRGLIKVSIRILGFVLSLIIALILYTPISNYIINNTNIATNLEEIIQERLYTQEQNEQESEETNNLIENFGKYIDGYTDEIKSSSSEYIAKSLSIIVVRIGTWIGLFLASRILMIFLKIFASIVEKIPIIKQFNRVRRNNLWCIRGILNSIHITCYNKLYYTNDEKQSNNR